MYVLITFQQQVQRGLPVQCSNPDSLGPECERIVGSAERNEAKQSVSRYRGSEASECIRREREKEYQVG